jgi:Na+-translocating ferredoxin:NAD+ oxidoreductase RnfC subunit
MKVKRNQLIFQVFTKDGHEYNFYLNGNVTGFPEEGTTIVNLASPIFQTLKGLLIREKRKYRRQIAM